MINADDMQSWAYLLAPTFQFINSAGKPLTEGWIEVYIAGTRNKYYCASDFNGTLHPFQIPLDSLGANIVLADPDQAYDVYVYNKYGSLIMSRYHVSPGMAGGSGVLSITITSEDGTVSVNNDGNGNFDLSIQDTVDRIDALEQAVSGLSADSSVGYAIAHAYTVELDGTFDLVNDAVTGIGYTPNMDGFRLKSGHVYQFNFNALFENGAFDRNCSGKLYLEGPNTIAQEWKFDLDDSYYHSQSINGSTVLVTPNDLNYYDVKLKLSWDVDYPNKPNVDLNKISIVDITTLLSTTVSGIGGNYTGGDGIFVNDESYVISVDMDYINSHLNIDATEIIASAVNIATAYTDARVTTVSGDLVNLIAEVSASIPTGIEQVQSDWTEIDSSSPAYIQHKPDLTVYATNASLTAVSSVLQNEIEAISGAIPTDYVTHDEVSAVSGNIIEYVNSVSGDLVETINNVSGDIIHTVESVSGDIINTVETVSGDIIETITTVSGDIIETINNVSGDIIETVNNVSGDIIHTVESVSGDLVEIIETATANIPEQVNADWEAVSGKAEILNKPDLSIYATHTEVSGVSAALNERINNVSGDLIETITTVSGDIINTVESVSAVLEGDIVSAIQVATGSIPEQVNADWNAVSGKAEILNKPDLSIYATHDELVDAVTAVSSMIPTDYVTHNEVSAVSANLVNYVNTVSGDITNYVDESIVSAINVATGSFEQVQSDWTEDDTNDPAYIQNKPNEIELIAGQNIGIFSTDSTITIAASATDISGLATHSEVNSVSGILESEIQSVSAAIGEQVPNVSIQSPSGSLVVTETVSGNNKIYSIDVAPTSGIEYGQFYATNITGAATMARTKGNIDITNDGKIKLKQGQSYHVTVRGRYNQTVLKDNYSYASYIEYVTNNSININVDESRSGSQYFELSYDLFKLNSDTDYYVFFTLDDATVNDLFIDIHSLANVGSNGSSGGSSPEYDAGYGIQILNNVISVSGIAPQVQSDWNQTNTSSVDYIKNKPEEYGLLAGDNISITASGNNFIISSTASAATGIDYQAGYGIDITGDTISVDASIIPEQQVNSDWTATSGVAEILNKPNESELIAGAGVSITASGSNYIISAVVTGSPVLTGYVTETELQTVSGNIVNQIPDVSNLATKQEVATVSGMIPDISGLATNADLQIVSAAIPDVSNLATKSEVATASGTLNTKIDNVSAAIPTVIEYTGASGVIVTDDTISLDDPIFVVAGSGINISQDGDDIVISCTVTGGGSGDVTRAELATVSGTLEGQIQTVSGAIPNVSNLASKSEVNSVSGTLQTEIVAISGAMVDVPTGVSGVVAGQGIAITASGSDYVISCTVTGGGSSYSAGTGIDITNNVISIDNTVALKSEIPVVSGFATKSELQTVSAAIPDVSNLATKTEVSNVEADVQIVSAAIPDTTDMATKTWVGNQGYLTSIPSTYVTDTELNGAVSGLATKTEVQTVSAAIPNPVSGASGILVQDDTISLDDPIFVEAGEGISITQDGDNIVISCTVTGGGSGDVTRAELISVSGTLETEIQTVSAALDEVDIPTGVSGLVAGDNITITASGSNYVISGQAGGSTYSAGDYIGITNNTISVTGITDIVAGNCVSITSSGNSAIVDWTTTAGITDIQMVNSLPASPVSTVLYLIPEA